MTASDIADITRRIERHLPQALSLLVGRDFDDDIEAHHVALADDAVVALRDQCQLTGDRISVADAVAYTATAELDRGEVFLIDDPDTLAELAPFAELANEIGSLTQLAPSELDTTIKFYAVALGEGVDRLLFVRRSNPAMSHRGAGRWFAIGADRLTRIEGPVFAFAPGFDFVLASDWAVVLDQRSFELLFRQIGLVERHVNTWIAAITDHLPMQGDSIEQLRTVALGDSRTWRRLRDIERRGHLALVTLDDVRLYAKRIGLDPDHVVQGDELVFEPAHRFGFLHLLNEDLYEGPLTGEPFESQRKASMR